MCHRSYDLDISKSEHHQKAVLSAIAAIMRDIGICLTSVMRLVMLPIPWVRSGRGSLPVQVSGGRQMQNPVLHLYGATGFSGCYGRYLHPLSLSGLPSYGFDPIYQGPCTIPDMAVFGPGCRLRPARAKGPKKTDCADVLLKIRSIHRQNSLANQLRNSSAGKVKALAQRFQRASAMALPSSTVVALPPISGVLRRGSSRTVSMAPSMAAAASG